VPDFSQSPPELRPATVVDHVLLPVADLEDGARRSRERYGLEVLAGGRHPNVGTANMIVPLGLQYHELVAVADPEEAARSGLGGSVTRAVESGRTFVAWVLRTDDMADLRVKLEGASCTLPPIWEGSRPGPDGRILGWRTQDLVPRGEQTALPFAIEWNVPEDLHPGRAEASHPTGPVSLRRVVGARDAAATRERLDLLVGSTDLCEVVEAASEDGVLRVVLAAPGEVVIE
jgi:hypothetical protein